MILGLVLAVTTGCTTFEEIAALRHVRFELDRISDARLAGVDVSRVQSASDLNIVDSARVAAALASGDLPISFTLHVRAENPVENAVTARLVRMRWTVFLEDTETVSGQIDRPYELPPGRETEIPVDISLDLLEFYERSSRDLIELAMNLAGSGGEPKEVSLRVVPTIDTPLGGIRYPRPITVVSGQVGRTASAR